MLKKIFHLLFAIFVLTLPTLVKPINTEVKIENKIENDKNTGLIHTASIDTSQEHAGEIHKSTISIPTEVTGLIFLFVFFLLIKNFTSFL